MESCVGYHGYWVSMITMELCLWQCCTIIIGEEMPPLAPPGGWEVPDDI